MFEEELKVRPGAAEKRDVSRPLCPSCRNPHRGGSWCSVCFAPLNLQPVGVGAGAPDDPEISIPAPREPESAGRHSASDPETAVTAALIEAGDLLTAVRVRETADPVPSRGRHHVVVTWPCSRCEAPVALESHECPSCGALFLEALSGDALATTSVPVIGALAGRSTPVRIAGAVGVAAVAVVVLIGLLVLLDLIF